MTRPWPKVTVQPFIANTDHAWFDFLSGWAANAQLSKIDEANFWSPKSARPMKRMDPGTPVFLRLKAPRSAIGGYGFFAHHHVLDLDLAWELFAWKNGDPDKLSFLQRLGAYRGVDLRDPAVERGPLGCTILRDVHLWPEERWIPWKLDKGWSPRIQQGNTERDPARAALLLAQVAADAQAVPEDFADGFELVDADERQIAMAEARTREGQGAFRARLLAAYDGRCAITGERTQPVLDAAHIQPYLGPRSNHVQNGLLLVKEFHALFDAGYVTVTPDQVVRVSPRLRADWRNGHRYNRYDGERLKKAPTGPLAPSRAALEWHGRSRFRGL